jgi:NADPH-dependent 2,4-dienoyl-CoA reductase/sulfur reductase-like enzyme
MDCDYLIVGGGLAAASAVDGIRDVDGEGSIVVLSDEEDPP